MRFWKYHAVGNDYLVVDESSLVRAWPTMLIQAICDRHRGIGSDGVLVGEPKDDSTYAIRIFNPDGSEAEKSGNGLRIFARYLWDQNQVGSEPFAVQTRAGTVHCQVVEAGQQVRVQMGTASFDSRQIPVTGRAREVLLEPIEVCGTRLSYSAVTVGNPHCVVFRDEVTESEARQWGPWLEREPRFPNRTNVQFVQILDRQSLRIEIWERGAGYTLSSGSSSCAAAAVAHRLGHIDPRVRVHMPGGTLLVEIGDHHQLVLTGPVIRIGCFQLDDDWWSAAQTPA
jgi:diaminopimelate epimerase